MDWFFNLPEKTRGKIFFSIIGIVGIALLFFLMSDKDTNVNTNTSTNTTIQKNTPVPPTTSDNTISPTPSSTLTPVAIPAQKNLFAGPLPVPASELNAVARNSIIVGTVLSSTSIPYNKKAGMLKGIATDNILTSSYVGTDEASPPKPQVSFIQITALSPVSIVAKISVDGKPQYVSFIKEGSTWLANAYNGESGSSR